MNLSEKIKTNQLISSILLIVIGVLFCALRAQFVSVLLTVVGVVLIILGVLDLIAKNWVVGAIELAVGIIIIACGWTIVDITLLILGIVLVVYAVYAFASNASRLKTASKYDKAMIILSPVVLLTIGILLIVAKWEMVDAVFIVLGVIALLEGIVLLLKAFGKKNTAK